MGFGRQVQINVESVLVNHAVGGKQDIKARMGERRNGKKTDRIVHPKRGTIDIGFHDRFAEEEADVVHCLRHCGIPGFGNSVFGPLVCHCPELKQKKEKRAEGECRQGWGEEPNSFVICPATEKTGDETGEQEEKSPSDDGEEEGSEKFDERKADGHSGSVRKAEKGDGHLSDANGERNGEKGEEKAFHEDWLREQRGWGRAMRLEVGEGMGEVWQRREGGARKKRTS